MRAITASAWRSLANLLVAVPLAIVTCGGDVVVDDPPEGSGGSGAATSAFCSSTSSVVASSASVSAGGAPSGTSVATVGSTGSGPCIRCAEALQLGVNPGPPLCPGSQPLFDALVQCVCVSQCPYTCGDNACIGDDATDSCGECIGRLCSVEVNNCANDA